MKTCIYEKYKKEKEAEKIRLSFENGKKYGNVILQCKDGNINTHSEMLILCSSHYQEKQLLFFGDEEKILKFNYDISIVEKVIKTYYGEETSLEKSWSRIKKYFMLAEFLGPCDEVISIINIKFNKYKTHMEGFIYQCCKSDFYSSEQNCFTSLLKDLDINILEAVINNYKKTNNVYLLEFVKMLDQILKKKKSDFRYSYITTFSEKLINYS